MQATPLTATVLLGPAKHARKLSDDQETFESISKLFENYNIPSDANIPEIVSTRAQSIFQKAIAKLGRASLEMWATAEKIYYSFMFQMVTLTGAKLDDQVVLINDGQFHRAIICIAMEIARFASNYKAIGFESILRIVDVNMVDLGLVLRMIIDNFAKVPTVSNFNKWPREVVKRLIAIYERILESDIWNNSSFHTFLKHASGEEPKGSSSEQVNSLPVSEVMLLYGKVMPDCVKHATFVPKTFVKHQPRGLIGYIYLYNEAATLARNRLLKYFGDNNRNEVAIQELGWKFLFTCMKNEHNTHLLTNRSIDVLVLCSLFLAFRTEQGENDSKWKELITIYESHPHFLQTVTEIN